MAVLIASVLLKAASPLIAAGSPPSDGKLIFVGTDASLGVRLEAILPQSIRIIDDAMATLQKGWEGMDQDERKLFLRYFDPGNTGEVDAAFVQEVIENYRTIRRGFDRNITLVYKAESRDCIGMRLYYTDLIKIYVCPYINQEQSDKRAAQDLVHEMAHISLLVVDRAYYSPTDPRYQSLTPNGHWTAELPVVGKILREIARADTLYHPDAYSRYAAAAAGL
jgi:hypothetical protein